MSLTEDGKRNEAEADRIDGTGTIHRGKSDTEQAEGKGREERGKNGRSTHPKATTTPPFSSMTDFLHPGHQRFSSKSAGSGAAVPSAPKVDIVAGLAGSADSMSGA